MTENGADNQRAVLLYRAFLISKYKARVPLRQVHPYGFEQWIEYDLAGRVNSYGLYF
jgi:hypothetical protein